MRRALVASIFALVLAAPGALAQQPSPGDTPPEDAAAAAVLRLRRFTMHTSGKPLGEALATVELVTGLACILDPSVDPQTSIPVDLSEVTAREALDAIAAKAGLVARIWCGVALVCPADRLPAPRAPDPSPTGRLLARCVGRLDLDQDTVQDVADYFSQLLHVEVVVDPSIDQRTEVPATVELRALPASCLLTVVTHLAGLTWRVEEDRLVLEPRSRRL